MCHDSGLTNFWLDLSLVRQMSGWTNALVGQRPGLDKGLVAQMSVVWTIFQLFKFLLDKCLKDMSVVYIYIVEERPVPQFDI